MWPLAAPNDDDETLVETEDDEGFQVAPRVLGSRCDGVVEVEAIAVLGVLGLAIAVSRAAAPVEDVEGDMDDEDEEEAAAHRAGVIQDGVVGSDVNAAEARRALRSFTSAGVKCSGEVDCVCDWEEPFGEPGVPGEVSCVSSDLAGGDNRRSSVDRAASNGVTPDTGLDARVAASAIGIASTNFPVAA